MLLRILFHINHAYGSFGICPDPHLKLLVIAQVKVVILIPVVFKEIVHDCSKGTDNHAGFTGNTKIGGPGYDPFIIFLQGIGRTDADAGRIGTLSAGEY